MCISSFVHYVLTHSFCVYCFHPVSKFYWVLQYLTCNIYCKTDTQSHVCFLKGSPCVLQIRWAPQASKTCRCLDPVSAAPTISLVPSLRQLSDLWHYHLDNHHHTGFCIPMAGVYCAMQCLQTAGGMYGSPLVLWLDSRGRWEQSKKTIFHQQWE